MRVICRLNINKIRKAKPGTDGKTVLMCDGGGLWLQVSAGKNGQVNKSWVFRYAATGTKISSTGREYRRERQMGLGPLDTVGLADRPALNPNGKPQLDEKGNAVMLPGARTLAAQARVLLLQGRDPIEARDASKGAAALARTNRQTFDQATEAYLQKFEDGWKNQMHRSQWRATLRDYASPVLGKLDVDAIDTEQVLKVLEPIWSTIPETAARVRGRIETVLDFAGRNEGNPARWNGHLEHRLAKRNKARTVKHLEAMPYDEIAGFMSELRGVDGIAARALELTVLTATRTNETIGAEWDEIDFDGRTWTIPASRTKRDREHKVPLSDAAIGVLRAMADIRHDDRIFPVHRRAMRLVLKDMGRDVTVHGFRATFRSWAGGCTSHPRDICETALGHSIGNAVEQAYQRDALLAKRRVLMADWAEFCAKPAATVLRMESRSREIIPA
jgi:integrase